MRDVASGITIKENSNNNIKYRNNTIDVFIIISPLSLGCRADYLLTMIFSTAVGIPFSIRLT